MLNGLTNLGPTTIRRLEAVGIRDRETLARVGPASAYRVLCAEAGARLPVCFYLYALEGALRGVDWRSLSPEEKARLRDKAGLDG
ncbi:MAG: TfoX/Sxy family DNA transformation protein [Myxococcota bacterium]